jgi:predicted MFS family arabinose efflux permease
MKGTRPAREDVSARAPSMRYSWYVLGILTLSQTCHGIDRAIIGLVLQPIGKEFALSDRELGLLAGFAYGLLFALAALPFGMAVDRLNRRNLMAVALTFWSAATALCGLATGFWSLVLGRAAVGAAEAGGSPTGISLLSDYFDEDRRATAIGIWYLSTGTGLALAFFVGGRIIEMSNWRWTFVAAGIPGLILAPLLFFTVREPKRGNRDGKAEAQGSAAFGLLEGIRQLATRPGLLHCIGAIVLMAIGIYGMSTWIATFLLRSYDMPISRAGLLVAIAYGLLGSIGGFAAGWVSDWINRSRGGFDPARTAMFGAVIPFITAITGIGAVAAGSLQGTLAFMMVCGFFTASYNGPVYSVIVSIAGPKLRGLAVSMVQLNASLIGVGVGTFLIGAISDHVGGKRGVAWGIGVAMLFTLWGGIHLLLGARAIRRGRPEAPLVNPALARAAV